MDDFDFDRTDNETQTPKTKSGNKKQGAKLRKTSGAHKKPQKLDEQIMTMIHPNSQSELNAVKICAAGIYRLMIFCPNFYFLTKCSRSPLISSAPRLS